MNDTVMMAVYAIGGMALMPLAISIITGIRNSRREYRRQAMLDRYAERIGR